MGATMPMAAAQAEYIQQHGTRAQRQAMADIATLLQTIYSEEEVNRFFALANDPQRLAKARAEEEALRELVEAEAKVRELRKKLKGGK